MKRRGIILAGGTGSRMFPITSAVCKQLLPVYDKPLIYYPLSTLMTAGIRDILLITTADSIPVFQRLFGDGSKLGLCLEYAVQERPEGIAQALIIAEAFLNAAPVALILGDNIFLGQSLGKTIEQQISMNPGAVIFSHQVNDPGRYGVVEVDSLGQCLSIEEKPAIPRSSMAVTGLYLFDGSAAHRARQLTPSGRGELEITDLNKAYLADHCLQVCPLEDSIIWADAGTPDSLLEISGTVASIQRRQGKKMAAVHEIAFDQGWIDLKMLDRHAQEFGQSEYGRYLEKRMEKERC